MTRINHFVICNDITTDSLMEVSLKGGVLRQLRMRGTNILWEPEAESQPDPFYRSSLLFPFPNRLKDGKYQFEGKEYRFPLNEPSRGNALHGWLLDCPFEKTENYKSRHRQAITLSYSYAGNRPDYPFPFIFKITYELLKGEALNITVAVENCGRTPMPFGFGWHPYFMLGKGMNDYQIKLPTVEQIALDANGLPTGQSKPYEPSGAFVPLKDLTLDDCFRHQKEGGRREVILWSAVQQQGLSIWQESAIFPFLQVFTPPNRQAIAIEPMTCNVNALQTGDGLTVLNVGEVFTGNFGVEQLQTIN